MARKVIYENEIAIITLVEEENKVIKNYIGDSDAYGLDIDREAFLTCYLQKTKSFVRFLGDTGEGIELEYIKGDTLTAEMCEDLPYELFEPLFEDYFLMTTQMDITPNDLTLHNLILREDKSQIIIIDAGNYTYRYSPFSPPEFVLEGGFNLRGYFLKYLTRTNRSSEYIKTLECYKKIEPTVQYQLF